MPRTFRRYTLEEFAELLDGFSFDRVITAIHMHHTWHPDHREWKGEASMLGMWRYHTGHNAWNDIAQHLTIAPDGGIWDGRSWNAAPASASGHNGDAAAGPFMFETVGNFDVGHDRLRGRQRAAVVAIIAHLQERFGLGPESLRFHHAMNAAKTCPGTSVKFEDIRTAVAEARAALSGATRRRPTAILPRWREPVMVASDPADAELQESAMSESQWRRMVDVEEPAGRPPRRRPRRRPSARPRKRPR